MCQSFAQTAPLGHTAEGVFSWRSFLSSGQNVDDLPLRALAHAHHDRAHVQRMLDLEFALVGRSERTPMGVKA